MQGQLEFNIPEHGGPSSPRDRYEVESAVSNFATFGQDWAVLRLKKNTITNQFPGDVQGVYEVQFERPKTNANSTIIGFGAKKGKKKTYPQQIAHGELSPLGWFGDKRRITHNVDTAKGTSGAPILFRGKIIGINTNGGCSNRGSAKNHGTAFEGNKKLQVEILKCLR
jgi:V8-like Glu-specific endopeptidase